MTVRMFLAVLALVALTCVMVSASVVWVHDQTKPTKKRTLIHSFDELD